MKITIWRIENAKHAAAARTGEGSRMTGGRWTSPGRPAIYCAEHLSLAILEILVHAPGPTQRSTDRIRFRLYVESSFVEDMRESQIPGDFSPRTPYAITRTIGDPWLEQTRSAVLSVPSAIVPAERNYILNPEHPQFGELKWDRHERISLDDRLWTVGG